jgi:HK97 gp10 family phage protein
MTLERGLHVNVNGVTRQTPFQITIATTTELTALDAVITRLEKAETIVATYADLVQSEAQHLVPVLTGALRASINVEQNGLTADVVAGEGLTYAAAVEYGTHAMPAHPYMRPASERYAAAFVAAIQAIFP